MASDYPLSRGSSAHHLAPTRFWMVGILPWTVDESVWMSSGRMADSGRQSHKQLKLLGLKNGTDLDWQKNSACSGWPLTNRRPPNRTTAKHWPNGLKPWRVPIQPASRMMRLKLWSYASTGMGGIKKWGCVYFKRIFFRVHSDTLSSNNIPYRIVTINHIRLT